MNLTAYQNGVLCGVAATSLLFLTVIGAGLCYLHYKHENDLDELAKDTAMTCIDFVSQHYEGIIRRREKEARMTQARIVCSPYDDSGEPQ